jgi:integrase
VEKKAKEEKKATSRFDCVTFDVDGRSVTIFKRFPGRKACYCLETVVDKKRLQKSLETTVASIAKIKATREIRLARAGKWEDVEKLKTRSSAPTFGELWDVYLPEDGSPGLSETSCSPRSAKDSLWALGKVLRTVLGFEAPSDNRTRKGIPRNALRAVNTKLRAEVRLDAINEDLAKAFQAAFVTRYCGAAAKTKPAQMEARELALRSSKSIIKQARSVFSAKSGDLRPEYAKRGVRIPDCVDTFLRCKLLGSTGKGAYFAPDDAVIARAFEEIEKLRDTDRETYLAFWLGVGIGLRRGEMLFADWKYFVMRDGKPWYSGHITKNKKKIEVPVQAIAWARFAPLRLAKGPILGEHASLNTFPRKLNLWLRQQGWTETEKVMHELRAYIGSLIFREDPVAAKTFMRHSTFKVTESNYGHYVRGVEVPSVLPAAPAADSYEI